MLASSQHPPVLVAVAQHVARLPGQPADRESRDPRHELALEVAGQALLPANGSGFGVESWWLQIGIELGIFGLFLYLALSLEAVRLGWRAFREAEDSFLELFALGAVAAFGGLTVYGITLPAWGYVAGPYLATLVIGLAIFHVRRADRLLRS